MGKSFEKNDKNMNKGSFEKEEKKKSYSKDESKEEKPSKRTTFDNSDEEEETNEELTKQQKRSRDSEKKQKKSKVEASSDEDSEDEKETKKQKKDNNKKSSSSARKAFYAESKKLSKASQSEIEEFRSKNNITIAEEDASLKPLRAFDEICFSDHPKADTFTSMWKSATSKFQKPSPIQAQTWPAALSGRDVVGIAETGSGKTLAFLLPAFVHILDKVSNLNNKSRSVTALVLSPTRELAMQIAEVASTLGEATGVKSICVYGGVSKYTQKQALYGGIDIIVATPGRLLDLLNEQATSLANISFLVLDEADRMLDMGFEKDIRAILGQIQTKQSDRQTLMFSATWPVAIQALASEFLTNPVRVTIGSAELQANHRVKQTVEVIDDRARDNRLLELLAQYHNKKNRVLIFVLYKKEAPRLEALLQKRRLNCASIHSDKNQAQRTAAFEGFRDGSVPLLIATDVAARGLDIPDVEYVINYSFPLTIEDYVHRIGRTGRGGKEGVSHTFFTNFDKAHAGELANVLRDANMEVPSELLKFGTHIKKKEHALYGNHFKAGNAAPMKEKAHIKFD